MTRAGLAMLLLLIAPAFGAGPDGEPPASVVTTWHGDEPGWAVAGVELEGLRIDRSGRASLVGWQHVRAITGDLSEEARPYLALGKTAWRAIGRLDRGDAFGAESLFESLFETYRGVPGPTSAAVAEGLMRCRLRRDARAAALDAWLDLYANLSDAPASEPRWGIDSPAIDPATLLAPALPPLWEDGQAARAMAEFAVPDEPGEADKIAWAMRVLYRAAARWAASYPIDADALGRAVTLAERREGGDLVAAMVTAQVGGAEARLDARSRLERVRSPDARSWRGEWATIAIGRSLLREDDEHERLRGVLELLSLHADGRGVPPYLQGLALADAVLGCRALGDLHAAGVLEGELRRDLPSHPVLGTPAFQDERGPESPGRISPP